MNSVDYKLLEHSELIITAIETAFLTENYDISRKILEIYFLKSPQQDQFYCRAKIILGLLIDHEASSTYGEMSIKQRKLALSELLKALEISLLNENKERYQFIIFNISLDCWKIVRQFLRKGRAKFFKDEMNLLSTSLEQLRNIDKNWLITFFTGTSFCYDDAEDTKKSLEYLEKSINIAEEIVLEHSNNEATKLEQLNSTTKKIEELQKQIHVVQEKEETMKHQQLQQQQQQSMTESETPQPTTNAANDGPTSIELTTRLQTLQKQLATVKDDYKLSVETKIPLQDRVMKLYFQKIYSSPVEGKKLLTLPQVSLFLFLVFLVSLL